MRLIRGYLACSLDGYIAEPDHGLGFLEAYPAETPTYERFLAEIGTVVMGRLTYEVVRRFPDWAYAGKRALVVTSRRLDDRPPETEVWDRGVDALIGHLRRSEALPAGDVWILGGGLLQQAFIDRDALDRLQLFLLPEILGDGIPMIPRGAARRTLVLVDAVREDGMARLTFERAAPR